MIIVHKTPVVSTMHLYVHINSYTFISIHCPITNPDSYSILVRSAPITYTRSSNFLTSASSYPFTLQAVCPKHLSISSTHCPHRRLPSFFCRFQLFCFSLSSCSAIALYYPLKSSCEVPLLLLDYINSSSSCCSRSSSSSSSVRMFSEYPLMTGLHFPETL